MNRFLRVRGMVARWLLPAAGILMLSAVALAPMVTVRTGPVPAPVEAPGEKKPHLEPASAGKELPPDLTPRGEVPWLDTVEAWRAAKTPARILYVRAPREFGCELLERITFTDADVLKAFDKKAVAARFATFDLDDLEQRRFEIRDVPAVVVLDGGGGYVGSITGYRPPARFLKELNPLLEQAPKLHARGVAADGRAAEALAKGVQHEGRIEALDAAAELAMERRLYPQAAAFLKGLLETPKVEATRSLTSLWMRLGRALEAAGQYDAARDAYESAKASDSLDIHGEEVAYRLADAARRAGDHRRAAYYWDEFLARYPRSDRAERAAFNRIYALYFAHRRADADEALAAMLKFQLSPETVEAARLFLQATGRSERALALAQTGLAERTALSDALLDGRDLVKKYSCGDCHLQIDPVLRNEHTSCVECHIIIKELEKTPARHDDVLKSHPHFFRNCARVRHTLRAPDLYPVGARVRTAWIRKFLENPYDVRPHLEESMVQMNLSPAEIAALVRYLRALARTADHEPPGEDPFDVEGLPAPGSRAEKGKQLFVELQCFKCHQFGNVTFGDGKAQGSWEWMNGRAEAPNLRFVRDRLTWRTAVEWIRNPQSLSPKTRMPKFDLDDDEVHALVDYLFHGDPGKPAAPAEAVTVKVEHAPTWDEVNHKVFQDTCVHCHMADHEGGAGNVGAYGYGARRLDLTSYANVLRGSLRRDGTRASIVAPRKDGRSSILWERVTRRVEENRRDFIEPFRDPLTDLAKPRVGRVAPGMPFGHPALTPEQLALLKAWLEAGAPGPKVRALDETPRPDPGGASMGGR